MKLTTQISLKKQPDNLIDYHSKVLLLGSCFADNIAEKFQYFKFQSNHNPFGILYHPKAIETLIQNAVDNKVYQESDVFFHNERWHCFEAHSDLSSSSKEKLMQNLNEAIQSTHQYIQKSTHIIITLGTAWSYRFLETDTIVANCHKIPQKQFKKEIQSGKSIVRSLEHILELIQSVNPKASIIFTVSPVRHLKDGFVENTQSKAHLIAAIHSVLSPRVCHTELVEVQSRGLHYFPSYEIMMDELRDYRFYAEDLVHPNQTAINYIWERFNAVWLSEGTQKTMEAVDTIQKGINHKPFSPKSKQHQTFLEKLESQKQVLIKQFPHIEF
jgi:hypothetical protein